MQYRNEIRKKVTAALWPFHSPSPYFNKATNVRNAVILQSSVRNNIRWHLEHDV